MHHATKQKLILVINKNTEDPSISINPYWTSNVFVPDKPCTIRYVKHYLKLSNDNFINYNNSTAPPSIWQQGNKIFYLIYYGRNLTSDPLVFPSTNDNTYITLQSDSQDVLDYGVLKVDKSPGNNFQMSNTNDLTFDTLGTIDGPIEAPGGIGNVGPLVVDAASTGTYNSLHTNSEFGGTTVDKRTNLVYPDLTMYGNGDYIRFTSTYYIFPNINTGQNITGFIELEIFY